MSIEGLIFGVKGWKTDKERYGAMRKLLRLALGIGVLGTAGAGCSVNQMVVKQGVGIIANGMPAFYREGDLELAETALASNIELMEALLETTPRNAELLQLVAQALTAYSFSFVERDYERYEFTRPARAEAAKARAKVLYQRAMEYARRSLKGKKAFMKSLDGGVNGMQKELDQLPKRCVPYVFWLASSWGAYIDLSKDDIAAVADSVKVERMMLWVVQKDETYFRGGAHLFLGGYYGGRPGMFGGDAKKSQDHFDQVDRINDNKLLMSKVFQARFLAVQLQDKKRYDALVKEILGAKEDLYPEERLMNQVARVRGEILARNAEEYF